MPQIGHPDPRCGNREATNQKSSYMSLPTKQQTNETLRNDMWRACDIMRRDNNVGGVMQYTEHLAWLLFLKFLDEEEKKRLAEAAFADEPYTPVLLGTDLAWDAWASPEKLTKTDADALITYVRGRVLPGLATLTGSPLARTVARIFSEETVGDNPNPVRNVPVCASGYNLKDVLEIRNVIRWLATRPGTTNCPYPTGSRNSPKAARSGTKTSTRRAPPGRTGNAGWTASVSAPFRWRLKCASPGNATTTKMAPSRQARTAPGWRRWMTSRSAATT